MLRTSSHLSIHLSSSYTCCFDTTEVISLPSYLYHLPHNCNESYFCDNEFEQYAKTIIYINKWYFFLASPAMHHMCLLAILHSFKHSFYIAQNQILAKSIKWSLMALFTHLSICKMLMRVCASVFQCLLTIHKKATWFNPTKSIHTCV